MKTLTTFLSLLLVAAALAGCAQQEAGGPGDDVTDDGETPPMDNQTMDNETMDNQTMDGEGEAEITNVSVLSFPETAPPGENATVCWRVEGSGTIPHTAVHFDTESHQGEDVTFGDYAGGAAYPGNTTGEAPEGYELPGEFCAAIPVPETGDVYFRAHAMIEPPGMLSEEHEIYAET